MSSIVNPQPELPAEEELVAYLDGELPPDECRRIEERLAADGNFRQRLHDLDQAWEALGTLPCTRTDDDFARTTMELVAVAAEGDLSKDTASAAAVGRRRQRWLVAAGIVAAVLGFAGIRLWSWLGDAAIVADLPVIRYVDLLTQIEDVEFLRQIRRAVPPERLTDGESAVDEELGHLAWISADKGSARWEWLEATSADEKANLASQTKRFKELPTVERRRIRSLSRDISQAQDAKELQATLLAYGQWLARLTPGEQQQLREELWGLPGNEQADALRRFVRLENEQASRRLSPEDAEKLRNAVLSLVEERRARILNEMHRRGAGDRAPRLEGPLGALRILSWELQNEERANRARERIIGQLSPEAQAHLERLGRGGRRVQLWHWIRDSLQAKVGPAELERFFTDELDPDQRERLLNLPPGEMQPELERLYFDKELGFRGLMEPGDEPGNPPGPGGPGFRREMGERDRPGGRDRFDRGPDGSRPPRRDDDRRPPPPRPDERRGKAI
ncbi:MAG: zf-HC2 domain-containing protein [Pirellulales bacterium]